MNISNWLRLAPVFAKCLGKLSVRHLWYMARQLRYENPQHHNGRTYVNTFFPPYPSKAFDRFLDAIFERRRIPFSTYFAVTDKCPYTCPHCSYGNHQGDSMDTNNALEIIKQIKDIGTITIGFTGGEPLVRDDIVELVEAVGDDTNSVMFSTGYRLNRELAGSLESAGLGCLTIGLEWDEPKEHDRIRGVQGSFDEGLSAIELSLEAGLYTAISTVGTRDKIENGVIQRLAELASRYGVHEFRILEPVPVGGFVNQNSEILSPAESKKLADFHKRWNRKGKVTAIASFAHLESDELFGCGAGFHHLFIDAVGNVCPCDLTPLSFGNVLQEPLGLIWNRMSQWFDLPRCGCLAKEICGQLNNSSEKGTFPVCPDKSAALCNASKRGDKLPTIFENLFRGRKPVNPPLNQP